MQKSRGRVMAGVYLLGFVVGILYTNVLAKADVVAVGMFGELALGRYRQTDFQTVSYLLYLCRVRLIPVGGLFLLSLTKIRRLAVIVLLVWSGFLCGIMFASAILRLGMKGMVLCIVSFVPQIPFYVFAYGILLLHLLYDRKIKWDFQKIMVISLAICIGIGLEWYINPLMVKMVLKVI